MPSPGDTANLKHNLDALADLVNRKPGSKLSYSARDGRFSIDEPYEVRGQDVKGAIRFLWRDSITNEEYFGKPIREVFVSAHAQGSDAKAALSGLNALKATYAGDPVKRNILVAVIQDASDRVHKEPLGVIQLRQDYKPYLKFGLSQQMFLPETNNGVCYSFTVHWARRILLGKANFGVSDNSPDEENPVTLDSAQKARIRRKVDVIRPMHAELGPTGNKHKGNEMMAIAKKAPFQKYGNLDIAGYGPEFQIDVNTSGSDFIMKVLDHADKCRKVWGSNIFLINLAKETEGHTIGIHLDGTRHLFDSNVGEFVFPRGSERDQAKFFNRWWKFYNFKSFALEAVMTKQ